MGEEKPEELGWTVGMYPNLRDSVFGTRNNFLETRLKEATEDYKTLFDPSPTSENLAEYLRKLPVHYRELFLDVSRFFGIIYNETNTLPEHIRPSIVLTMMFSIIERLQQAENRYVDLGDWLRSSESRSQLAHFIIEGQTDAERIFNGAGKLLEKYYQTYGSVSAITDFYNMHFTKKDRQELVRTYLVQMQYVSGIFYRKLQVLAPDLLKNPADVQNASKVLNRSLEDGFLPLCYDIRCYIEYGSCWPDLGCRLDDDLVLKENLTKVVKQFVYGYRNKFVHDARLVILAQESQRSFHSEVLDVVKEKPIVHELNLEQILKGFRLAFKSFFDEKVKRNLEIHSETESCRNSKALIDST